MLYVLEDRSLDTEDGSTIIAYLLVLVFLIALVAVVISIALACIGSIGIETLGDGIRILESL